MNRHPKLLTGSTLAVLALLFIALVVFSNVLLRGVRLDLTANGLYTLSDGTLQVLEEIEEPVNLYFFVSDKTLAEVPNAEGARLYSQRVREFLEEIAAAAGSKIRLSVIDPLPFSEEEDKASGFGLQAVPVGPSGENVFFGLAGTNSTDGSAVIPFFQFDKEAFLEYDVAKLIHSLSQEAKPVVGLMSTLDMMPGFDPGTRQMKEGWAVISEFDQLFEVRKLDPASTNRIDDAIQVVILVHPKALPDDALYALDQFVLRGGRLLVFVDPDAQSDTSAEDPNNPQAAMFADKSSELDRLFSTWGVQFDRQQVVLDAALALQVGGGTRAPVRHPAILQFSLANMNQDDVTSAQLEAVNMATTGHFRMVDGATASLQPLIQSSENAMLAPAERLRFMPDPSQLFEGFVATGENYVVAARLAGKLKTAFPERSGEGHLAESSSDANVVLVADTDLLTNNLWVRVQNFFGQQIASAFANNGDFVVNVVDNLQGSGALISVRARGASARPFETVEAIRRDAEARFRATEQQLQQRLNETERKLGELQQGKTAETAMILSPEQQAEIERFQKEKLEIRQELRGVRRQLDADIESLGTRLKLVNIGLVPLLLTIGALLFAGWRVRQRKNARAGG